MRRFLILGAGFTGSRVARRLREKGFEVLATTRANFDVAQPDFDWLLSLVDADTVVLHSIPTLHRARGLWEATPTLVEALARKPPGRIVYLSTTGVYGSCHFVDENTEPEPRTDREQLRRVAELAVERGPWSHLVLRPAAIYGPGRGMHVALAAGNFRLAGEGGNFVSRIHVDDLAAHAEAALLSGLSGAYPVADNEPCTSREAARFCCQLLGLPEPPPAPPEDLGETRRADRRVDASAIRRLLNVQLEYPTYREGFAACVREEARAFSTS